jgi:uncharacterized protein
VSQQNVETLRRLFEAEARDDAAAALECLHPDLEFIPMRARTEGAYRGHDGYERFRADTFDHYESFEPRFELEELAGDRVLAWGTVRVRGRGSGLEMDVPSAGVFEFRDGRILRWEDFGTREKALEMSGGANPA